MNEYANRYYVVLILMLSVGLIFVIRLFSIQALDNTYKKSAENNSRRTVIEFPTRGLVYSRDSALLVENLSSFDLMVIPENVQEYDTVAFMRVLSLDSAKFYTAYNKAKKRPSLPATVYKEIPDSIFTKFQEIKWMFSGFYLQTRALRYYPLKSAAHILGYIGEVNKNIVASNKYYKQGDYIGITGIEKTYEEILRGQKGKKMYSVDARNRVRGSYKNGEFDEIAISGKNIMLSIDADLQLYGEKLMGQKRGSIVAIEPSSGEILCLISSPSYNPNLLVGKNIAKNYGQLRNDKDKLLFNRAVMAQYPPGSTFKIVNALIGLEEKVITIYSHFNCSGGYHVGNFTLRCHHYSSIDFFYSIQGSCNAYYCNVFDRILRNKDYSTIGKAYTKWRDYVLQFGLGKKLGTDLAQELKGYIPEASHFDKYYGKDKWRPLMLISMAIGQGELGFSPMQMANMTAIVANRGYYYIPHLIKEIEGIDTIPSKFSQKQIINIDSSYFDDVIKGMERVLLPGGTAPNAFIEGLDICGKTGTAENPHGKDHSIFVAFAPKINPKIAVAVYLENAGYGSTYAAPLASLMVEKYLRDSISHPEWEYRLVNTTFKYKK
ncbi:MAG: penicillin-binding protein 2 [Bacteroidales bacterium]|nr:penicillin-binding protein 2 [Bacteroidales bacterium]